MCPGANTVTIAYGQRRWRSVTVQAISRAQTPHFAKGPPTGHLVVPLNFLYARFDVNQKVPHALERQKGAHANNYPGIGLFAQGLCHTEPSGEYPSNIKG